jgi:hypothetical protein
MCAPALFTLLHLLRLPLLLTIMHQLPLLAALIRLTGTRQPL